MTRMTAPPKLRRRKLPCPERGTYVSPVFRRVARSTSNVEDPDALKLRPGAAGLVTLVPNKATAFRRQRRRCSAQEAACHCVADAKRRRRCATRGAG